MAWSGVLLKLFDVGAKWASIAVILNVFAGVPLIYGIVISGTVSLFYVTLGGLWADAITDLAQFVVQLLAAYFPFSRGARHVSGALAAYLLYGLGLPPANHALFNGPYTPLFCLAYAGYRVSQLQRRNVEPGTTIYRVAKSGPELAKPRCLSSPLCI